MPLKKTIRIASMGVPAEYHVIRRYSVDLDAKTTYVDIASFYEANAARDGLQSIGMAQVMLDTMPRLVKIPAFSASANSSRRCRPNP